MKTLRHIQDLAVLGAPPAFRECLHVGCPNLGDREAFLARVEDALDRRWLTNDGPMVKEFEQRVANYVGAKHCVAMCNGTIALEIAIRAAGLSGEVIIPSYTFIATAHALQWQEITPVFCDINPATHTIDPQKLTQLITPRTTGIIGVHTWGRACDIEALTQIADERGFTLMFDAAHAFGCSYHGQMIGGFGQAEVFSFHATKFVNSLEGGAVVTNDDDMAERMRLMRNFGFAGNDNVIYVGTNGKMNEVCAAMGLSSMDAITDTIDHNRRNYLAYRDALSDIPGVSMIRYDEAERCNYQYIYIEVDEQVTGLTRDELVKVLTAENVMARRYFFPGCHRMEPYKSFFPHSHLLLPETEYVAARVIVLPTGTAVTHQVATITELIRLAVRRGSELTAWLGGKTLAANSVGVVK